MANDFSTPHDMMWAHLIHLSYNFWLDREEPKRFPRLAAQPYLRFDESLWDDLLPQMAAAGTNAVVIDLGDAIQYQSHPEIAVENAWSPDKLRSELSKMRALGLEPIPKLNFSASHDVWLGEYSRMVSTPKYYEVCGDLIREVCELFDTPRFLHLGMDEETAAHQQYYLHAVMRQHDLWWHDLLFFVDCVEACGVRAWVWSDSIWYHEEAFLQKMPKSVLQSNWYYGYDFAPEARDEADALRARRVRTYARLEEHGYDQVPTSSNYYATALPDWNWPRPALKHDGSPWQVESAFGRTVDWCREQITPEHLQGFFTAPWHPTWEAFREVHLQAIEEVASARETFCPTKIG